MMNNIYTKYNSASDTEWLQVINKTLNKNIINNIEFPSFPSNEIQRNFTGRDQKRTLLQAFNFYLETKKFANLANLPINEHTMICEFGVGWGRIIRFFLKDTKEENLTGLDPNRDIINICKETFNRVNFTVIPNLPPINIVEDNSFDIIYAFSVFSHIRYDSSILILKELHRKLKAGGLIVFTSRGKVFMDYCKMLRHQAEPSNSQYIEQLKKCFIDVEKDKASFDNGIPIFNELNDDNIYGESAIPPSYFVKELRTHYQLVGFENEFIREDLDQTITALQKI